MRCIDRRGFLKASVATGAVALGGAALGLAGCGESRGATQSADDPSASASSSAKDPSAASASPEASPASDTPASGALVVYFSHVGENYGVGYIEEGNTAIVAKMIAKATGADLFEIEPVEAYPSGYDECCDVALAEQNEDARPAYAGDIDVAPYQTIYLGYPIWWGDLPMCAYTFLEAHDWAGKDIHPFCTHAGSGLAGTVASVQDVCADANVGQGLSVVGTTAQNSRDEALSAVEAWLG